MKRYLGKTVTVGLCALMAFGAGMAGAKKSHASDPFLGQIQYFGFNFAPRGWALCDGQLLPINQNQALFSLFGTTYGGDGRTTFALPDMRGRAPLHFGQGPGLSNRVIGQRGGVEQVTLNITQIPSHNHLLGAAATATLRGHAAANGDENLPTGNSIAPGGARTKDFQSAAPDVDMHAGSIALSGTTLNNGGSQSHENMPPFLVVNCSVAMVGVFPSRN